jgi:hypothetical protein
MHGLMRAHEPGDFGGTDSVSRANQAVGFARVPTLRCGDPCPLAPRVTAQSVIATGLARRVRG